MAESVHGIIVKDEPTGTVLSDIISQATAQRTYTFPDRDLSVNTPDWYNVKDYGATGDGVTDDYTAILAAVTACPAGGTVYFPGGQTYICNTAISITKAISIVGEGWSTVIKSTTNTGIFSFAGTDASTLLFEPRISNIRITTSYSTSTAVGLDFSFCTRLYLSRIYVDNFGTNIRYLNSAIITVKDCLIALYKTSGLSLNSTDATMIDAGDHFIYGTYFTPGTNAATYSIFQQNSGGTKIVNCKFNGGSGSFKSTYHYFYNGAGATVDLLISNSSFENFTTNAILMQISSGSFHSVVITGNQFGYCTSTTNPFVSISNITGVTIANNGFALGTNNPAISLSNCSKINVGINTYDGTTVTAVTLTSCTSVAPYFDGTNFVTAGTIKGTNSIKSLTSTATAAGTTTLTVTSNYLQIFTGSTTQTVVLPVVTTLTNAHPFRIVNNSSGVVTVNTSGGNTIKAMAAGSYIDVWVINTGGGTGTASWNWIYTAAINN